MKRELYAAFAQRCLGLGKRPVDPLRQQRDVLGIHRGAAPDAQARRRVAVVREIVAGAFLLHQRDELLGEVGLRIGRERGDRGIDHLQAHRGVGADRRILRQEIDPRRLRLPVGEHLGVGVGARHQRLEAADRLAPVQRVEIVLDAQHRRRVDGLALEDAFVELAALGHAEDFRQRPGRLVGLEPLDRARREHQHAVRGLAAQRLLPGEGHDIELRPVERLRERRRGGVADGQALAVGADPVGIGHAHAGGGAVPGEDDVGGRIDLGEIGDLAVSRVQLGDVLELQFLDDVADPALAEGFPGDRGDGPRAEQRPQRHFDRAGIGGRHDADPVIGGHFKHFARQLDRELELGLADLRAMRTAERCVFEILGVPAGALGTGAGRKMRHVRPRSGLRCSHDLSFQIVSLPLGGGVPPRAIRESSRFVKELCGDHARLLAALRVRRLFRRGADRRLRRAAGAGTSSTHRRRSTSRPRQSRHRPSSRCS